MRKHRCGSLQLSRRKAGSNSVANNSRRIPPIPAQTDNTQLVPAINDRFRRIESLLGSGAADLAAAAKAKPGMPGSAAGTQWVQESPAGARNGSNTAFTLTWTPETSAWTGNQIVILALNGVELTPFPYTAQGYAVLGGDYTLDGKNITLVLAPKADDYLIATYFPVGTAPPPAAGGPPPGSGKPSAAALFLTYAFTRGAVGYATITLWDPTLYGMTSEIPVGLNGSYIDCSSVIYTGSPVAQTTQSFPLITTPAPAYQVNNPLYAGPYPRPAYTADTVADLLSTLVVTAYVWDSASGAGTATLYLYDCYLQVLVNGVSTTYRPRSYQVIGTNPSSGVGQILNPTNAYDTDPASYSTIIMQTAGNYQCGFLRLYNWG